MHRASSPPKLSVHEQSKPPSWAATLKAASSEKGQYGAYVGQLARGAGISFFGQGVGRFLNYATQIALAWMYGPAQFGAYALGITLVQMANILAQLGMDNGVVRYVAHYRTQRDAARVRGTVLVALGVPLALSVVLACLIFFGAGLLAGRVFGDPSLETMFKLFSVSLPALTVMNMALFATQGFMNQRYTAYVQQILQPLTNLALIVVLYFLGARILGAAAAYIVSMLIGCVLALYYLNRVFPRLVDRGSPTTFETRALISASWPMTVFSFTQRANYWVAVLVVGIFATTSAVGIFNAAARTAALAAVVLYAFNGIFSPMISSLYGSGRVGDLGRLYQDVSRWVFTGGFAVFLLTVVLGRELMAVFGPEFVAGWTVLVILAAGELFNSAVGPTQRVLSMTRHQKVLMFATAGSAVLCVGANVALVPGYGIMGAAVATAVATALANVVTVVYVRRLLGVWPFDHRYAKPAVAGLLAAAGVYLGQTAFPFLAAVPAILVFAPLFMAGLVAALFTLGLSASDRQLLTALSKPFRRVLGSLA
jgi:O-antigen/teichoic acid export membrane protein